MSNSKRRWTDQIKFKIVLELLKEQKAQTEIAKIYQVHPTQMRTWKNVFLARAPQIFSNPAWAANESPYQKIAELERIIGQLTIENTVLKKTLNS